MKRYLPFVKKEPLVAVIRLQGVIASGARGTALNDTGLAPLIERAFRKGKPAAVALVINSPGGSPAQSSLIAARVRRLAEEHKIPVYAFVEDVAASGGYWLATAADEIWVDENSIVGSIGVISAGFGFDEFISRYGIQRRVYTAGKSKSLADPFRPENPDDVARIKDLQEQIHESFINQVKRRRGDKLAEGDLYTGEIWVGDKAREVGLVEGVGHIVPKMKEIFGEKVLLVPYQLRRPFASRFGLSLIDAGVAALEERAVFARYGL
ncbi:MAG: S49 family peptidase [Pseudomonadota bacterium]